MHIQIGDVTLIEQVNKRNLQRLLVLDRHRVPFNGHSSPPLSTLLFCIVSASSQLNNDDHKLHFQLKVNTTMLTRQLPLWSPAQLTATTTTPPALSLLLRRYVVFILLSVRELRGHTIDCHSIQYLLHHLSLWLVLGSLVLLTGGRSSIKVPCWGSQRISR